jgi:hypothetical protein
MVTTISLSEDTKRELDRMKVDLGYRSMDALLKDILADVKNQRLEESSELFRRSLRDRGLTIKDVQVEGRRMRRQIYSEQFE